MKINSITPLRFSPLRFGNKEAKPTEKNNPQDARVYNPIAHNDHSTGRLFRSPEDFYSQPFNKNGMPDTMKNYLNQDFATRQHIPPMQVMQIIFAKLDNAKSLDEVKTLYPNEKLFKNLTSSPKVKTAVISDIEYVKKYAPESTLFKNGHDDLGMYLLKKIYLEGKTLPEIDKDFQKDVSSIYKGIAHIKDETIYSYGIRRPQNGFWQSLVHNRENFPYVYVPRSKNDQPKEEPQNTQKQEQTKSSSQQPAKPRRKLSDEQKRALSEYMTDLWKNLPEEERERRKKKIKLGQENSFLFQYSQPIMTLAAAQINLSDKLSDYLSTARLPENLDKILKNSQSEGIILDFDNPDAQQKAIMRAFWKDNNELKGTFGQTIREILDEFQQAYGVDGENQEFKILVKIADDIRNENAMRNEYRRKRKADVEAAFKDYQDPFTQQEEQPANPPQEVTKDLNCDELLDEALKDYDVKRSKIVTENGEINLVGDFKEEIKNNLKQYLVFYPQGFINTYMKFLDKCSMMSEQYMASYALEIKGENATADLILPKEERDKTSELIANEFVLRNPQAKHAANQVVIDIINSAQATRNRGKIYLMEGNNFYTIARNFFQKSPDNNPLLDEKLKNKLYEFYRKPLNPSEINKINKILFMNLKDLNTSNMIGTGTEPGIVLSGAIDTMKKYPQFKTELSEAIRKHKIIENYGGSTRVLLSKDKPQEEKYAMTEAIMYDALSTIPTLTYRIMMLNPNAFQNL